MRTTAELVGRRALRWGAAWGVLFGFYIADSAIGYSTVGGTAAARLKLARTLGTNLGLAALFGPPRRLDTVTGWTAWRSLGVLGLLGGIIGLLLATRLMRGEEEAGRWELLLAGPTTRGRAAVGGLLGLAAGVGALFVVSTAVAIPGDWMAKPAIGAGASTVTCLTAALTVAVFVGIGALAGQLAGTRRQAATVSAVAFGVAFLLRAASDSSPGLRWARWTTPLGWPSEVHAMTGTQWAALLPPVAATAALAIGTVAIARSRDLGAAALPARDRAPAHTRLLGNQAALAVRLVRGTATAWIAALAVGGGFLGLIAQSASQSVSGSKQVTEMLNRLGAHRSGAAMYLGIVFIIVTALVAFAVASLVTATRNEEAEGYLDNLLVRPVGRVPWLAGRTAVTAAAALACGLAAGLAGWAGAATQSGGVSFGSMVGAGINAVPPALLLLGVGTLTYGLAPRRTGWAVYALLGWGFLIETIGAVTKVNHWVLDTSILHHATAAPAADPNWASAGILAAVGLAAVAAGAAAFRRRDLAGT